jgi:hypothetical protein
MGAGDAGASLAGAEISAFGAGASVAAATFLGAGFFFGAIFLAEVVAGAFAWTDDFVFKEAFFEAALALTGGFFLADAFFLAGAFAVVVAFATVFFAAAFFATAFFGARRLGDFFTTATSLAGAATFLGRPGLRGDLTPKAPKIAVLARSTASRSMSACRFPTNSSMATLMDMPRF